MKKAIIPIFCMIVLAGVGMASDTGSEESRAQAIKGDWGFGVDDEPEYDEDEVLAESLRPVVYPGNIQSIYEIGDIGPGGGKIFYVSKEGFTVQMINPAENYTAHYLEVYPEEMSTAAWAIQRWDIPQSEVKRRYSKEWPPYSNLDIQDTGTKIGTGRKNTDLILYAEDNTESITYYKTERNFIAAARCRKADNVGKMDWFLPSKEELNALYKKKELLNHSYLMISGSTHDCDTAHSYWSSSQCSETNERVWVQYLCSGMLECSLKHRYDGWAPRFRPIRAF